MIPQLRPDGEKWFRAVSGGSPLELELGTWFGAEVKAKPGLLQLGRGRAGVGRPCWAPW